MWVGHGVRDLGQWGWGHSPSFVVGIQNRGCMRVGPRRFCLELDREWGLESCVALVGVSWEFGHLRVTQGALRGHGVRSRGAACVVCGL
jgi:hypothetical protein